MWKLLENNAKMIWRWSSCFNLLWYYYYVDYSVVEERSSSVVLAAVVCCSCHHHVIFPPSLRSKCNGPHNFVRMQKLHYEEDIWRLIICHRINPKASRTCPTCLLQTPKWTKKKVDLFWEILKQHVDTGKRRIGLQIILGLWYSQVANIRVHVSRQ